jgi:hypothetical protein
MVKLISEFKLLTIAESGWLGGQIGSAEKPEAAREDKHLPGWLNFKVFPLLIS